MKDFVTFDMETNGLLYEGTRIHCIVLKPSTQVDFEFYYDPGAVSASKTLAPPRCSGGIADGVFRLHTLADKGHTLVGHNILGFDFPFLKKVGHRWNNLNPFNNPDIHDTYVDSCLLEPERMPGLEAWGSFFGIVKPPIEDWSSLTPEILYRCEQDVIINERLHRHLYGLGSGNPEWAVSRDTENKVLWIHSHQVLYGMRVDILRARGTLAAIDSQLRKLESTLHKSLPPTVVATGAPVTKVCKVDGTPTKQVMDWFTKEAGLSHVFTHITLPIEESGTPRPRGAVRVAGPFTRITFEPVNLNSHVKVKELLLSLGWVPTEWNRTKDSNGDWVTTSPKLTEESYDSLPEGLGKELAEYLRLVHRRRFILNESDPSKGLLSFVRRDGRVACDAFTCGTNTGRYRHSGAFVNLPKITTPWGPEIRSLFCVPNERWLIGIDLSGIEARMMGHYAWFYDKGDYINEVLLGDIHTKNAAALGVDRETAKTFLYAISYGAGATKLAGILGCSVSIAKRKIKAYWRANPGIEKLIAALESEYSAKGYITGLDGRRLFIRGSHKLLNTLIQNAATVVFKLWMIKCYEYTHAYNGHSMSYHQVLAYHDELGWEYIGPLEGAEVVAERLVGYAGKVGDSLGLKAPIDAKYKIGKRYNEVH